MVWTAKSGHNLVLDYALFVMTPETPVVTIDGPAGAGKGTIAQQLAHELGWHILDSGSLYRLTAYSALKNGCSLNDIPELENIARNLQVEFLPQPGGVMKIILGGADVSQDIRSESAGEAASKVASINEVREALLQRQRDFAQAPGLVCDGRDMGTVVFPRAMLKIYLTASAEVRAQRRLKQLKDHGLNANLAALIEEIQDRDFRDKNRVHAPLLPAFDAIEIDSSELTIGSVVSKIRDLYESKVSIS